MNELEVNEIGNKNDDLDSRMPSFFKNSFRSVNEVVLKEYDNFVRCLEKDVVQYNKPRLYEEIISEKDIIKKVSGGDYTEGSCSSVALAYIGNKAGCEVLDFRGGVSRMYFSSRNTIDMISKLPNVEAERVIGTDDIDSAHKLFSMMKPGDEYFFAIGNHVAIIKKDDEGIQYLELQHPSSGNGWHLLNDDILSQRFGCSTSHDKLFSSFIIKVDSLVKSKEFRNILGYINTDETEQKKGAYGHVR